jgi:hypothetical protein
VGGEMSEIKQFNLVADRKGVVWDILLYVPTVIALASIATSFWFGDNQSMGYLFYFLTCFFLIAGVNRIFKTRLMLFPSAPVSFLVDDQRIELGQKNGNQINLIKNIRYYSDYAGKSFGLSGLDGSGKQMQFVFLKGQFTTIREFESAQSILNNKFKK